jgi:hypothetical protein
MADRSEDQERPLAGREKARPYQTPRLLVYGAMRELTASGSSGSGENKGKGGANKFP